MYNIAVVGGGVTGITSALVLQEDLKSLAKVTVFTEKLSPYTTGDVSAGLWGPFILQDTKLEYVTKWSKATQDFFLDLWKKGYAEEAGICLQPVIRLTRKTDTDYPEWLNIPFGSQPASRDQLNKITRHCKEKYGKGYSYVCLSFEPTKFLPFFQKQFIRSGGIITIRKITDFQQLSDYDVIVNCTGLNSRYLANDEQVRPIRGQVLRMKAPWQFHTTMDDENYVITNYDSIIFGGTAQVDDYDTDPRESDTKMILEGCHNIYPSLQAATFLGAHAGLRPGRPQVRLELEIKKLASKDLKIVHNYGHGGSGVTLSYGCALDVKKLVKQALNISGPSKL